jgi:hypothetical protein
MQQTLTPGQLTYFSGYGLSIVIGKKIQTVIGMGPQIMWGLQPIYDASTPIFISEIQAQKRTRAFLSQEEIENFYKRLAQKNLNFIASIPVNEEKFLGEKLSSLSPTIVADTLIGLIDSAKGKTSVNLEKVIAKYKSYIEKAARLLASDLAVASGLSLRAAYEHILSIAVAPTNNPIKIWPLHAISPKASHLDDDVFEEIFGINKDQALDLNAHPVRPDISIPNLIRALNEGSTNGVSEKTRKEVSIDNEKENVLTRLMPLAPQRGAMTNLMDKILPLFDAKTFQIVSLYALVLSEHRLSVPELAEEFNTEESEIRSLLKDSLKKIIEHPEIQLNNVARVNLNNSLTSLETRKPKKQISTSQTLPSEIQAILDREQNFLNHNYFLKKLIFLSTQLLNAEQFEIFLALDFRSKDYPISPDDLATTLNKTVKEVILTRNEASWILRQELERRDEIPKRKFKALDPYEIENKEENTKHFESESKLIDGIGINRKLFVLASQLCSEAQFLIYCATELRRPESQLSYSQIAVVLNLPLEDVKKLRNEAASLIYDHLAHTGKLPKENTIRAIMPLGFRKGEFKVGDLEQEFTESAESETNNDSQETVLNVIRSKGYDENTLYELAKIKSASGLYADALLYAGVASLLSDEPSIQNLLQEIELKSGRIFDPHQDSEKMELRLQEELNGNPDIELKPKDRIIEETIDVDYVEIDRSGSVGNRLGSHDEGTADNNNGIPQESVSGSERVVSMDTETGLHFHLHVPKDVLVTGQVLKVTFGKAHDGQPQISLEVRPSSSDFVKENAPNSQPS